MFFVAKTKNDDQGDTSSPSLPSPVEQDPGNDPNENVLSPQPPSPEQRQNVETDTKTVQTPGLEDTSYRVPTYFVLSFEWVLFTAIISSSVVFVHVNLLQAPAETLDCIFLALLLSILNLVWCVVCIFMDEDTGNGRFTNGLAAACTQSTAVTTFHVLLVFWYGWLGDVRYNPVDVEPVTWHQLYSAVVFVFATVASIVASAASFAAKPARLQKGRLGFQVDWIFNSYSYSMLATLVLTIVQREKLQESRAPGGSPLDTTVAIFYVIAFQFVHMLVQIIKTFLLADSSAIVRTILYGFTFFLDLFIWLLAYSQVTQSNSKITLLMMLLPVLVLQAFTTLYRIAQEFLRGDKKGSEEKSRIGDEGNTPEKTSYSTVPVTYTPQALKRRIPIRPAGSLHTPNSIDVPTNHPYHPYVHTSETNASFKQMEPSTTAFSMRPSMSYQQNILRKIAPSTFQPQTVPTPRHWSWNNSADKLYDGTHPKYN